MQRDGSVRALHRDGVLHDALLERSFIAFVSEAGRLERGHLALEGIRITIPPSHLQATGRWSGGFGGSTGPGFGGLGGFGSLGSFGSFGSFGSLGSLGCADCG